MSPRNKEPKKGTRKSEEVEKARDAAKRRRFKNGLTPVDPEEAAGIIQRHLKYVDRTRFIGEPPNDEIPLETLEILRLSEGAREARVCKAVEALLEVDWKTGNLLEKLGGVAQTDSLKEAIAIKLGQWPRDMSALFAAEAKAAKEIGWPGNENKGTDEVRYPFSRPGLALFTRPPGVTGERKVFGDPDTQGSHVTIAVAACNPGGQKTQAFPFEELPYHDGLGDVYPGTGRAVAVIYADNKGSVSLCIRTLDKETDVTGSAEFLKTNSSIELVPLKPANGRLDIHEMKEEARERDIGYPKVCVVLRKTEHGSFYEVSAIKVPKESMDDAMALVDTVGRHLLEAKEIPDFPDPPSLAFARSLSKA